MKRREFIKFSIVGSFIGLSFPLILKANSDFKIPKNKLEPIIEKKKCFGYCELSRFPNKFKNSFQIS